MKTRRKLTSHPQPELHAEYVRVMKADRAARQRAAAAGLTWLDPGYARLVPRVDFGRFAELVCGATSKRTGKPCKRRDLYASGRCKFHGGLSTGPKTPEGRAASARNGRRKSRTP